MPSTPTEAKYTPWSVSRPKGLHRYLVRLFDAQDRLIASSSWHDASPNYPTEEQSIENFERIAAAVNERSSLLSLIEDMAKALKPFAPIADEFAASARSDNAVWGYNGQTVTHGDFRDARSALSRYTEFMEQKNG